MGGPSLKSPRKCVINTASQFFFVRDEVRNISSIGHAAVSTRAELATLYQTVMTAASTGRRLEEVFPHGREASVVTIAVAIGCAVVGGGISGGSLAVGAAIFCMTILEPTSLHRRELKENARKLSAASVNSYMTDNGLELLKDSWCVAPALFLTSRPVDLPRNSHPFPLILHLLPLASHLIPQVQVHRVPRRRRHHKLEAA